MGGVRRGGLRIEVGVARFDAGTSVFVDSRLASGCDWGRIGGAIWPRATYGFVFIHSGTVRRSAFWRPAAGRGTIVRVPQHGRGGWPVP
jgi:hypothetical protein